MSNTTTTSTPRPKVQVDAEPQPGELEICCPKCGGFVVAVEPPAHRLEQNVVFRVRVYCKRCPHRFTKRVTFNEQGPNA